MGAMNTLFLPRIQKVVRSTHVSSNEEAGDVWSYNKFRNLFRNRNNSRFVAASSHNDLSFNFI